MKKKPIISTTTTTTNLKQIHRVKKLFGWLFLDLILLNWLRQQNYAFNPSTVLLRSVVAAAAVVTERGHVFVILNSRVENRVDQRALISQRWRADIPGVAILVAGLGGAVGRDGAVQIGLAHVLLEAVVVYLNF